MARCLSSRLRAGPREAPGAEFGVVALRGGLQSLYAGAVAALVAGNKGTGKRRLMENWSNGNGHALDEEGKGVGGTT